MKVFVDTGDVEEIREAISWGIVDGVTTNPTLIRATLAKRPGAKIKEYLEEVCRAAGPGRPVSLEVMSTKAEEMIEEGRVLYERYNSIAGNAVIKVPVTTRGVEEGYFEGVRAIRELSSIGIPVNATLIMTPAQAVLAAKAGAKYVSPFLGRVDDYIRERLGIKFSKDDYFSEEMARDDVNDGVRSGVDLLRKIRVIFRAYGFNTEIIAASVRNARQATEAMLEGADIITVPFEVLVKMVAHPKSEEGIKKFVEDAVKANYGELFRQ